MTLFPCRACAAKEAEIQRLTALLQASIDRADRQAADLLQMARDATGLPRHDLKPQEPDDGLPQVIQDFLDVRFERGTSLWRQQHREARKLLDANHTEEQVIDTLSRGMVYEP